MSSVFPRRQLPSYFANGFSINRNNTRLSCKLRRKGRFLKFTVIKCNNNQAKLSFVFRILFLQTFSEMKESRQKDNHGFRLIISISSIYWVLIMYPLFYHTFCLSYFNSHNTIWDCYYLYFMWGNSLERFSKLPNNFSKWWSWFFMRRNNHETKKCIKCS